MSKFGIKVKIMALIGPNSIYFIRRVGLAKILKYKCQIFGKLLFEKKKFLYDEKKNFWTYSRFFGMSKCIFRNNNNNLAPRCRPYPINTIFQTVSKSPNASLPTCKHANQSNYRIKTKRRQIPCKE